MSAQFPQGQMKPLFMSGPSLTLRLLFFVLASLILMTVDHRQYHLDGFRAGLSGLVYPVQYVVNLPAVWKQLLSEGLATRNALTRDNSSLIQQNLLLKARLQKFSALEVENMRLRELLQSSRKLGERMLVAELLAVDMDPFRHKVTLNKGSHMGVIAGQPLLDSTGVMGQIVHVGPYTSTALLITDPSHALPVQINRSGLRGIAIGTGSFNRLELPYLSKNADVRVGDLLITSGLGGGFPADYPVAEVISVERDPGQPFAKVSALPTARLERSREVLLVWPVKARLAVVKQPPTTLLPENLTPGMAATVAAPSATGQPADPPTTAAIAPTTTSDTSPGILPATPPNGADEFTE
jgi:rod shape-determining protein MreC